MLDERPLPNTDWKDRSASVGPALLGCAAGILLGGALNKGAKQPVILSLALLGVAALAPNAVAGVVDKVAGPNTRRGHARRLQGIRNGGYDATDLSAHDPDLEDEYLGV